MMTRWSEIQRLAGRHVYRLCIGIHPGSITTYTGNAYFSSTLKHYTEEALCSTLYIPGDKGAIVDGVVSPYLEFSKQFQDVVLLERSISLRGIDVNIKDIIKKYSEWEELQKCRSGLEDKRVTLTKTINALKNNPKNKERINELKEQGKKMRSEVRSLTEKIWDIEEVAVIGALSLPNNLHDLTGTNDKLLFSLYQKPIFNFNPKSHIDLGRKSKELEMVDNSPTAYYLQNRLALVELVCSDYFLKTLSDEGFIMTSNSDFVKSPIIEGCGVHFRDRLQHNTLSSDLVLEMNSLHLVGGASLQAFSAYFTKQIIEKSDYLPYKLMTAGRNYSASVGSHPGLLGCRQSSVVDGFVLYEDVNTEEKTLLHEAMVMLIQSYLHLDIHFQVVQYSAEKLHHYECAAVGFLMYSPYTMQYHEVARISLCGDYISRRLWTICKKDKAASFVSMLHIRACNNAPLLALLMENQQQMDGFYTLPPCLQSCVDSF